LSWAIVAFLFDGLFSPLVLTSTPKNWTVKSSCASKGA
jgi:hypothetical protein